MTRKDKRPVPVPPSPATVWQRLRARRKQFGKFVGRHAVAGFLTGTCSALGAFSMRMWLG